MTNAQGLPEVQGEEQVSRPDSLPSEDFDTDWCAAGNGWAAYPQALADLQARIGRPVQENLPHAEDIARLAVPIVKAGKAEPAALAQPSYVRDNVARKSTKPNIPGKA